MQSHKNILLILMLSTCSMHISYSVEEESFNMSDSSRKSEEAPGILQRAKDWWNKRKLTNTLQNHAKNLDYIRVNQKLSDSDYKAEFNKRIQLNFTDAQKEAFNKLSAKAKQDVTNDWLKTHKKSTEETLQDFKDRYEQDLNNFTKNQAKQAIKSMQQAEDQIKKNNVRIQEIEKKLQSKISKLDKLQKETLRQEKQKLETDNNQQQNLIEDQSNYLKNQAKEFKKQYETAVKNFTALHAKKSNSFANTIKNLSDNNTTISPSERTAAPEPSDDGISSNLSERSEESTTKETSNLQDFKKSLINQSDKQLSILKTIFRSGPKAEAVLQEIALRKQLESEDQPKPQLSKEDQANIDFANAMKKLTQTTEPALTSQISQRPDDFLNNNTNNETVNPKNPSDMSSLEIINEIKTLEAQGENNLTGLDLQRLMNLKKELKSNSLTGQ